LTLEAAVLSCLDQSLENLELLLICNGSDAETRAVARRIGAADRRVRLLEAPSFFDALEMGWRQARAPLLARMDADDLSAPTRFERQLEFLNENSELSACASLVTIRRRSGEGKLIAPADGYALFERWLNETLAPEAIARERFIDSPIANPSAMIRREVFETIGGYRDLDWAEDYDFWLRMLDRGMRIGKVPEHLLTWIDGEERMTRNHDRYTQDHFLQAKAHFLARLPIVREKGMTICGAGPIGKRLAPFLQDAGAEVHAFAEVSPRRIGNRIHGIEVRGPEWLESRPAHVMIGAVGLRGARERLRKLFAPLGYQEGEDFFLVA